MMATRDGIPEVVVVRMEDTVAVGAAWRSPGRGNPAGWNFMVTTIFSSMSRFVCSTRNICMLY